MARTKPSPRPSPSGNIPPPRKPPPRDEGCQHDNASEKPPTKPAKIGASSAKKTDASSNEKIDSSSRYEARAQRESRGTGEATHQDGSSKQPSTSESRVHHSGSTRRDSQSQHESCHRTSDRDGGGGEARAHNRGSDATHQDDSSKQSSSASVSRGHRYSERSSRKQHRPSRESHRTSSRSSNSRDANDRRGSGYGYDYHDRSRSQRNHVYDRRDGRRQKDYQRSHDDVSWRNNKWRDRSGGGYGRGREPQGDDNYYSLRNHKDRSEHSHRGSYGQGHASPYERHHEQGYGRDYDDYHGPNPAHVSAPPPRDEHRTRRGRSPGYEHQPHSPTRDEYKKRRESKAGYDSDAAQNEHKPRCTTKHPAPAPSIAPSQNEVSENEKLKLQLEQEELETKIALQRLEKERIKQQLILIRNDVAVQPENVAAAGGDAVQSENVAAVSGNDVQAESVVASSEGGVQFENSNASSEDGMQCQNDPASSKDASQNENIPASSEDTQKPTSINIDSSTAQYLMDDDSIDDVVLPTRTLLNKKGKKRDEIPPHALRKKKTDLCRTASGEGAVQLSRDGVHESTAIHLASNTTQDSMDDDSADDVALPRRKQSNRKCKKRAAKPPSPSRKKKTNRRWITSDGGAASSGGAHKSTEIDPATSVTQYSVDDNSIDDIILSRRKPSNKKGKKRTDKPLSPSQKKRTNRRKTGGKDKKSGNSKRKLHAAQMADDEKKKRLLLKVYEDDLARRKAKNIHRYTEKDLMSSFTPEVIDHYLFVGGKGKFLVEWSSTKGKKPVYNDENRCISWISHEDFLFPALARGYLSRKISSNTIDKEIEGLKLWKEDCEERERCLNCLNTFDEEGNENEALLEIDFCCFLCKCPWDHPLKRVIRNCPGALKYHRGCCHQYQNEDDFEAFVSPVGKAASCMFEEEDETNGESDVDESDTTNSPEAQYERLTEISQITRSVTIVDGECEKYLQNFESRSNMEKKRDAIVLCINAGVGSAIVSLKHLGLKVAKVIHVESDRVAQHVIRSHHDYCYGEIDDHDQIEHVTGLYNTIGDIAEDPEKMVRKYGPIDMIICNSPRGKSSEEDASYAVDFFEIVKDIERLNTELYHFDNLFYLLECSASVKNSLPLQGLSYCFCDPTKLFVCNWPISSQKANLLRHKTDAESLELQKGHVLDSVRKLYASLLKALVAGFDHSKWRDTIHCKYWPFLSMGPKGYDVKLKKGEFGPEAFLLSLRNPENSQVLSDTNYSNHLLGRSSSVKILLILLEPMRQLFNEKNYGSPYNATVSHQEKILSTVTLEHGGIISRNSPNSKNNDVASDTDHDSSVVKTEVKDEETSTDDEAKLFDLIEKSFSR